ncbi:hypothetical protein ACQ4LE_008156 [Meloidogyne hapla]|uniref:Uncharacterized protein n=1 Tax=Meloidogyne hapla TaxID=6305 RepID=A0A1I8B2Z8_MELHA
MVRAFATADEESFKDIVNKYSRNQHTERMERIFSKKNLFQAYIKIVSLLEAPLKILEAENKCTMNRLMVEMIKLENAWREKATGDDLIQAALAKSGLSAFNRKMKEIFKENPETMRTEIDYEMEQYQIGCKNLGGQKLDLLNFWKTNCLKMDKVLYFYFFFKW